MNSRRRRNSTRSRHVLRSRYGAVLPSREQPQFTGDSCNTKEIHDFWTTNTWTPMTNDIEALLEQVQINWVDLSKEIISTLKAYFASLHPNQLQLTCIQNLRNALDLIVRRINSDISQLGVPLEFETGYIDNNSAFEELTPEDHTNPIAVATYTEFPESALVSTVIFPDTQIPDALIPEWNQLQEQIAENDRRFVQRLEQARQRVPAQPSAPTS